MNIFTGKYGRQGEPGVSGASHILTYPAGEILSGHRMVVLNDGEAFYADSTILNHANRVVGMTTGAAMLGADVPIHTEGEITEPSWNWTLDVPVWLGLTGLLTQVVPTSGFSLIIGFPLSAVKLFISIREPIFLT